MDNKEKALIYAPTGKPNVIELREAYDSTQNDLEPFFEQCRDSYDARRNYWPGKTKDLRKHGSDAFPWEGASDMEADIVNERLDAFQAMCLTALNRANIRAYPTEANDIERAAVVSTFLKWMVHSYIPRFKQNAELAASYMFERGIAITYVGWNREDRTYKQLFTLDQLIQMGPQGMDMAEKIMSKENDDEIIDMFLSVYPDSPRKRMKKALNDLRKTGQAEIPVVRQSVNHPYVETLSPDGDFFFPSWVTDPQRAPYCFWRTYYTPQELLNKVETDGWDEEWVEEVIKKAKMISPDALSRSAEGRTSYAWDSATSNEPDLIEVIFAYQRLVDKEDGSEGIYCTILNHEITGDQENPLYAKHELLNGFDDYPVVVTKMNEDNKRLYDVKSMAERLRGIQSLVKVERDSRIDRASMATLPPKMHPIGRPPADWGPGRNIPYMRGGEIMFADTPNYDPGSLEIEQTYIKTADAAFGLDYENPLSVAKRQFYTEKFLQHMQGVIAMAFKAFQRMGPDSVFIQVTGVPEGQQFDKGNPDDNYNISIRYDVLNSDPESMEKKLQQLVSLMQLDRNGRIDPDKLIDAIAGSIDPILADMVLQPAEQAQQQIVKHVTEDLTSIYSGIERPARPNGAQIAMSVIQQYAQQPDIQQRLQEDETFAARLEKYQSQYMFQMQQMQNAQIGKIGTQPASMGDVNTQAMQ